MAFNLGIDVGDARIVAATERQGTVRLVAFGRGVRSVEASAFVGSDGAVAVGEDAASRGRAEPDGFIHDVTRWLGDGADHRVNGWAVTGDVLFAHVLAAVARQAATDGEELGRVTLAHPGGWPPARVAALRSAAAYAGMADADVVPAERAAERAPESVRGDLDRAAAIGAAVLATARRPSSATAATQVVAPVAAGAVPAPDPVTGSLDATSVFGADVPAGAAPAAPGGAGGGWEALPPGGSGGGGAGGGSAGAGGAGGGFEPPERNRLPFYIAGGVLVVLLIVLVVVLAMRDGDGDDTATGATTTTAASTSSSSTSTSSTTTSTSTSTTTSTTSTTTTSTSTTTTTIPREIGKAGLLEAGLVLDYGTSSSRTLLFGDAAADTIPRLTAVLGGPDDDTGWMTDAQCFGDQTRRMTWGHLEVVFTEAHEDGAMERTFEQWFVRQPGTIPPGIVTLDRLGIGSTVADLKRTYPQLDISHPIPGDDAGFFTTKPEGNDLIAGITTDTTDAAKVVQMWAGAACQRLAE